MNDADRRPGENDDNSDEFISETGINRKGKATHESVLGDQTIPYKNTANKFNSVANSRSRGKNVYFSKTILALMNCILNEN